MRAMVLDQFGGPEVLHMAEIERPAAQPGGVVVQVAYASVNPADWKAREGWLAQYFNYQFPFVVGFDAAGIVAEVGEGVTGVKVGDRVVTASNQGRGERGSYAEYVASDVERVVKLPDGVALREAATLPTAGMTAWEAVTNVANVKAGQKVLVNGGAGGTGSFAIQLAKMAGAEVAATCGPHNVDYVRSLGADLAIDYRKGGVADAVRAWAPDGVDAVIDTVGQGSLLDSIEMVKRGGVVTPITTLIADETMPDAARAAELGVRIEIASSTFPNQPAQLRGLVDALGAGRIRVPEITELPLDQAGEAHIRVAAGHVRGKIVLHVSDEVGQ
ncbi:NADPH:quinone reductase [Sphingomonas laterariae]|uniref:NADPH:quinone reductase n=1 Tax=Edaphosphingomonas laterariae TaxID=861865 RepID=A0A239I357_9SPHN|nr:NADP-dependent oxidoreductase [Sphingomonas laterariae]SNS86774.1 NADPH:quinone reductase [Sphingomonas laterariae]